MGFRRPSDSDRPDPAFGDCGLVNADTVHGKLRLGTEHLLLYQRVFNRIFLRARCRAAGSGGSGWSSLSSHRLTLRCSRRVICGRPELRSRSH